MLDLYWYLSLHLKHKQSLLPHSDPKAQTNLINLILTHNHHHTYPTTQTILTISDPKPQTTFIYFDPKTQVILTSSDLALTKSSSNDLQTKHCVL